MLSLFILYVKKFLVPKIKINFLNIAQDAFFVFESKSLVGVLFMQKESKREFTVAITTTVR